MNKINSNNAVRLLLDSAIDPMLMISTDGTIHGWNKELEDILNIASHEQKETILLNIINASNIRDKINQSMPDVLSGLKTAFTDRILLDNGSELMLELKLTLASQISEKEVIILSVKDITKQTFIEKQIKYRASILDLLTKRSDLSITLNEIVNGFSSLASGSKLSIELNSAYFDNNDSFVNNCRLSSQCDLNVKKSIKIYSKLKEDYLATICICSSIISDDNIHKESIEFTSGLIEIALEQHIVDESMRLSTLVYQNSSEGMVVIGSDYKIIDVNDAFVNITGYPKKNVLGVIHPFFNPCSNSNLSSVLESIKLSGQWSGEFSNKRMNGDTYTEEITINTIHDEKNKLLRYVLLFSDITKRKITEELFWRQANYDPLTGLANRRMFRESLMDKLMLARSTGHSVGLFFLDLDRFKEVNDTLGHEVGDELLKESSRRILSCVRDSDTVSRLGGDEFTIIVDNFKSKCVLEVIASKILASLSKPFVLSGENIYISTSIGITIFPDHSSNIDVLIKNADQAMYASKLNGRNMYSFFETIMQEQALARNKLLTDLRHAIKNNEFVLLYQPIVCLKTNVIHKAEALIRWMHPENGIISPANFIPLAEESGLIDEIGEWVFNTAANQVLIWRATHDKDLQISINKSPMQINSADKGLKSWGSHLEEMGLPGQSIVVEITEGLLLDANEKTSNHLLALRDAGIQVALDDFGTGYSALAYIKKFDIDYIKIDQSFTRGLGVNPEDLVLCEAIIVMAHKLGLKVIAEGVETDEQRSILMAADCDYAQGYLFSRPISAEAFGMLMAQNNAALMMTAQTV